MLTVILVVAAALVGAGLLVLVLLNKNRKSGPGAAASDQPVKGKDLRGSVRATGTDD
jgi:preprotein translocase subunit SecG